MPPVPLLFVICYDVLIQRIDDIDTVFPHACADDLAIAATRLSEVWQPMRLVDSFRQASGLGINEDKTRIISARSSDISSSLSACPWKELSELLVTNTWASS